jgi:hypothetical protein
MLTSITSSLKSVLLECERRMGPPAVIDCPVFADTDKEDRLKKLPEMDAALLSCRLALEELVLLAAVGMTPNEWRRSV